MSNEMLELADKIEWFGRLDAQAGVGALCASNAAAIIIALRASAVAKPVAQLRMCGMCHTWNSKPCGEQCGWSPKSPAFSHPAPAAPVPASEVSNYNEQALSKFLWENCGFVSPSTATELARQLLGSYRIQPIDCASIPAPEAAPTREEIAACLEHIKLETYRPDDATDYAVTIVGHSKAIDAILALKSAPAK